MDSDMDCVDTMMAAKVLFGFPSATTREERYYIRTVQKQELFARGPMRQTRWVACRETPVRIEPPSGGDIYWLSKVEEIGGLCETIDGALDEMRAAVRRALGARSEYSWLAGADKTDDDARAELAARRAQDEW